MKNILKASVFFAAFAVLSAAGPVCQYHAMVDKTPGIVAHWRFEETIDPRLETRDKGTRVDVDEQAMRGTFFPGGGSLKVTARLRDSINDYGGRTEEVGLGEKGIAGKAFRFSGKSSVVYIFRDAGLESGADDFSMELWIKPESVDKGAILLHRLSPFPKATGYVVLSTGPNGNLHFTFGESQDRRMSISVGEGTIVAGKWQHIVALRRGASLALYVNGKPVKEESGPAGLRIRPFGNLSVGADDWGGRGFVGLIDEVAYYNVALPAEEIARHWQAAVEAP